MRSGRGGIDLYFSEPHRDDSVIRFYGGEPLLHPALVGDCLDSIVANHTQRIRPKIITNGTLIGDEVAALLRRFTFDLNVSLDGDRDANDAFRVDHRGRSSYEDVLRGIRFFQEEIGNNPAILVTVGAHNIDRLPEVVASVLSLRPKAIE